MAKTKGNKRSRKEAGTSQPTGPKPVWTKSMKLSYYEEKWQPTLYREKLSERHHKEDLIIAERKTDVPDFQDYGLVKCFERLGWLTALTVESLDSDKIYLTEIIEWMSTLKKVSNRNHPRTTKLVGTVKGIEITLSFETLDEIADNDTGADNPKRPYKYPPDADILCEKKSKVPRWLDMLRELFALPYDQIHEKMRLSRSDLKPLSKLITNILCWNIVPRTSDKAMIRSYDVPVLYALCTGFPTLSFKHMVLLNVWEARESPERSVIPYCRLLSHLLWNAGVISDNARPMIHKHISFCISQIRKSEFEFKKTRDAYILEDKKGRRTHEEPRDSMEEDEEDNGEEEENEREEEENEYDRYERGQQEWNYTEKPVTWGSWSPHDQASWERDSRKYEEGEKWKKKQDEITKCLVYQQEKFFKKMYDHSERVRHHKNYKAGVPYQETYIPVDYSTRPLDATLPTPGYPQMQPPDWWPQSSNFSYAGEGSINTQPSDPFETSSSATGLWESIFGAWRN